MLEIFVGEFHRTNQEFLTERSFFGILKIQDAKSEHNLPFYRNLVHGTTLHGKQGLTPWPLRDDFKDPLSALVGTAPIYGIDRRDEPLTYYHRTGPVGHMFTVTRERLRQELRRLFRKRTQRRPMVIPVVMEV